MKVVMSSTEEEHASHVHKTVGVLGIVFLLAGFWLYASASIIFTGSQPHYRDYDPEMAYLLNSLAPFKGAPYFYTDHPGTPVEILGTVLLGAAYLFFTDQASFINYYLENPVYFLSVARGLITLLSLLCAICFFLTALATLQKPNAYLALSLGLLFYGLHPDASGRTPRLIFHSAPGICSSFSGLRRMQGNRSPFGWLRDSDLRQGS
jgi:hypothetical protein